MSAEAEEACDAIVRPLPGATIVYLSLPKATDLPDLPDRRYRCRGVAFWCEVKAKRDKLSMGQYRFLEAEYQADQIVFAGDAPALEQMVYHSPPSRWRAIGWAYVQLVLARGFRKER